MRILMPRLSAELLGTLLVVAGLSGFALLQVANPLSLSMSKGERFGLPAEIVDPLAGLIVGEPVQGRRAPHAAVSLASTHASSTGQPITRLSVPSVGLDTPVSLAPLAAHDGASTWEVPKFVAGHAEGTAGAGEQGNAVLIGHVTSVTLGNVFERLNVVHEGDVVHIFGGDQRFEYRVAEIRDVKRSDLSVLAPTDAATLTMITCSGQWLPTIWDYTARLVVRADLSTPR
jgi:LPXTG-site transpeptidase (sortase) family protein